MAELIDKIAFVTGASRGIGQAAARSLAQNGARMASDAARWITGHTIAVDGGSKL